MRKKTTHSIIVMMVLLATLIVGCAKQLSVEASIQKEAKRVTSELLSVCYSEETLEIKRDGSYFKVYPEGRETEAVKVPIPSNFYEKEEFYIPNILEETFPERQKQFLEKAKSAVIKYIEDSEKIKGKDKIACKSAVETAEIRYGEFEKGLENNPMITSGKIIYVNSRMEEYMDTYFYVHELIHVCSNVTNRNSTFEKSVYRGWRINEVITDLIAKEVCKREKIKINTDSTYSEFYADVYPLIVKYNLLDVYYDSELYSDISSNMLDLYFIVVQNFELAPGQYSMILTFLINECR